MNNNGRVFEIDCSEDEYIKAYINLLLWSNNLTDREQDVLIEVIKGHQLLLDKVAIEYIPDVLLGSSRRREICDKLSINSSRLSNIIAALKAKGVLDENGVLPELLIPNTEVIFRFNVDTERAKREKSSPTVEVVKTEESAKELEQVTPQDEEQEETSTEIKLVKEEIEVI